MTQHPRERYRHNTGQAAELLVDMEWQRSSPLSHSVHAHRACASPPLTNMIHDAKPSPILFANSPRARGRAVKPVRPMPLGVGGWGGAQVGTGVGAEVVTLNTTPGWAIGAPLGTITACHHQRAPLHHAPVPGALKKHDISRQPRHNAPHAIPRVMPTSIPVTASGRKP